MNCDQVTVLPRQIDTPRLRLREPAVSDAGEIFRAYTQDAEVSRFMIWKPHASEAVTREFLAWCVAAWQAGGPLPYVRFTVHPNVSAEPRPCFMYALCR